MVLLSLILFSAVILVGLGLLRKLWQKEAKPSSSWPEPKKVGNPAPVQKEINPFVYALLLAKLSKLKAQGELATVVKLFQEQALPKPVAADQIASYATLHFIVGECYQRQLDWTRAITCYEQALYYYQKIGHNLEDLQGRLQHCHQQVENLRTDPIAGTQKEGSS